MYIYTRNPIKTIESIPIFSENDEYVDNYDLISNEHLDYLVKFGENPFMSEEYWRSLEDGTLSQINKHIKKGDKILDIGVGLGRLLSDVSVECTKYGVDISLPYLLEAKSKGINVCLSKIEELPYQDDFFDIVISTDVLEHVFDLYACIKQIYRVVKPGGVIIVRVPYKEDLSSYVSYEKYKFVHVRSIDKALLDLYFTKFVNGQYLEHCLLGQVKDPNRCFYKLREGTDKLNFYENLITIFRHCKYEKRTLNEFRAIVLNEYKKYDFKFKKDTYIYKLLRLVYWFLDKVSKDKIYTDSDFFEKVEISIVYKKISN